MIEARLLDTGFDPASEIARFAAAHPDAGGVVSFLGQVRGDDGVQALDLRAYAAMTLAGMQTLAETAAARWPLAGMLLLHRCGIMAPRDAIVLVIAVARHRRDAFAAVDYAMDHLKGESWFWKREQRNGEWQWIEPRAQDHADRARW